MIGPGKRLGQYEISSLLGKGGMGEVWRATDTTLGRDVAIKVLPEEFTKDAERLARFEREARVLASLDHSNVASIFGLETADGVRFLVMQLADGEDLSDRLNRGPIATDDAVAIALQIADGLDAAHSKGIVHRDLKPANIKLDADGNVRILDFGLAKALDTEEGEEDISNSPTMVRAATHAGVILGTAAYMSPEQARGKAVDKRADIWAFGVVLWEMLTGKRLFSGETVSDTLAAVLKEEPDLDALPASTPASVRRVIRRCLQKNPKKRIHDIVDARIELTEDLGDEATKESGVEATRPNLPLKILPWVIALMAAAFGIWAWLGSGVDHEIPKRVIAKIPPPADANFLVSSGIAISPDGSLVVFGARDASGTDQLWLQSLEDGTVRPISGTKNGRHPFWSPDSRALGFFDVDHLKRVTLDNDVVETLAEVSGRPGGTWNSQGVVVFTFRRGVFSVRAGGGDVERLSASEPSTSPEGGDAEYLFPTFLPDGVLFLYLARDYSDAEEKRELRVGSLEGGPHKLVTRINSNALYSRSGDLIWWQDGNLRAQPFDLETLELTGESRLLRSGVQFDPRVGLGMFSISNDGSLVYREGGVVSGDELGRVDRGGADLGPISPPGNFYHPRLSPDGTMVAVDQSDETNRGDIWIYDVSRGTGTRVTSAPEDESVPVWSPDGKQLAFYSAREVDEGAIHVRSLRGVDDERLLYSRSEGSVSPLSWSSLGAIATEYSKVAEQRASDYDLGFYTLAEETHEPGLASRFNERDGSFSPDGGFLAFDSDETGRLEVYVERFPSAGERWRVSTDGGSAPFWRSDGREEHHRFSKGERRSVS